MSISPSYPYTLVNGATADATQVMGNFNQVQGDVNSNAAPLASPTFTGTPAAPTAAPGTNTTQLATCAFALANSSSKVTTTQFTDATDIVLAVVPTQTNVGTAAAITIPAKGYLLWLPNMEVITATGTNSVVFGLRIGSTNYWPTISAGGTTEYAISFDDTNSGPGTSTVGAVGVQGGAASSPGPTVDRVGALVGMSIEGSGIPTGAQTVQVIAGKSFSTNACTLKGTVITTLLNLIIVGCT